MTEAIRDQNHVTVALGVSSSDSTVTLPLQVDPSTGRLKVDAAGGGGGYTNLTQFVDQTAWRLFYSNTDGDVVEFAFGADGTYLRSNGAAAAPTWDVPGGAGTVTSVAMSVPTGLLISGSPITSSGTLAVTLDTGYVIPTQAALDAKAPLASPTFTTSINGAFLTASEILITDVSKNIVSAPVATYPSLTELTYVKGVTSAIQTQLNAKGAGTVTSVGFTGGLISVATATTTPAFTVAGTSGGIVYFSAANTWASSAALAANAIVIGGGAGVAPSTTTTGTGVLTALGINVGSAGAFVTFNGALGTPSSGTVTNLTGTASININGTVGATTPTTGVFTTIVAGSTTSLLLGTAGSAVGNIGFRNATSGTITLAPVTGALGTVTLSLPAATDQLVARATTDTLTNKRITRRVGTTTSSATPTINTDNVDYYSLTAQTVDITSFTTNLSGTPTDNQTLWISITGTAARAITWGASFEASTVALPTTTVTTARLDVGFVWNAATSKWRCVASA